MNGYFLASLFRSGGIIALLVILFTLQAVLLVMMFALLFRRENVTESVNAQPKKRKPTDERAKNDAAEQSPEKAPENIYVPDDSDDGEYESGEEQQLEEAVTVESAEKAITDDAAIAAVAYIKEERTGKMGIINVDTLNDNFRYGAKITLEKLCEKGLLPDSVSRVKILARGELKKKFTVVADDFSIQAIKMIQLAGGRVVLYTHDV